jgi:hypothetical protein
MDRKMEEYSNQNNEPVCRFGPGGEYSFAWPDKEQESAKYQTSLTKVLLALRDILYATLGSSAEPNYSICESAVNTNRIKLLEKGLTQYVPESSEEKPHTPAIRNIKSHSQVSEQQLLFTDDSRIGIRTVGKQKHRIRTHRRGTKKRTSHSFTGEGSLFEPDFKSAKTA